MHSHIDRNSSLAQALLNPPRIVITGLPAYSKRYPDLDVSLITRKRSKKSGVRTARKGLRLGRVNTHGTAIEVNVFPAQSEELRLSRACPRVNKPPWPTEYAASMVHNPADVIHGHLGIPGLLLSFLSPLHRVLGDQLHLNTEVEDRVHVVTVPIHRGLGTWLAGLWAAPLRGPMSLSYLLHHNNKAAPSS